MTQMKKFLDILRVEFINMYEAQVKNYNQILSEKYHYYSKINSQN